MIQSGQTKFAISQMDEWQKKELQLNEFRKDKYGHLEMNESGDTEWGFNTTILKRIIHERPIVPFYNFMLIYIINAHQNDLADEIMQFGSEEALYFQVVNDIQTKKKTYLKTSDLLRKIVDLVYNDFVTNGYGDQNSIIGSYTKNTRWKKQELFAALTGTKITFEKMIVLALGLNMDYEDVEVFLTKALKRTTFNLWSPDEFILYMVFAYANENRLAIYQAAMKIYKDPNYPAIKVNWTNQQQINTVLVKSKIDYLLAYIRNTEYSITLDANQRLSKNVIQLICFYKYLITSTTDYVPTIQKEAQKMLLSFIHHCKDMEAYIQTFKEEEDAYSKGYVQIYYDLKKGVHIPKDTLFFTRDHRLAFRAEEECYANPTEDDFIDVEIPVRCCKKTTKTKNSEDLVGYVPKDSSFILLSKNLKGIIKEMHNKSGFKAPTNVAIGEETYVSGKIYARTKANHSIPLGTLFGYKGYEYEVTELVEAIPFKEVFVKCTTINEKLSKNQIVDCDLKDWQHFFTIGNKPMNPNNQKEKAKEMKVHQYLYPSYDPYITDHTFNEEEMSQLKLILEGTQLDSTKISNIQNLNPMTITRNVLLTLCFLDYVNTYTTDQYPNQELRAGFIQTANETLRKCGFYEIYQPNPYDTILLTLASSSEALAGYRNLWAIYLGINQEAKNGK